MLFFTNQSIAHAQTLYSRSCRHDQDPTVLFYLVVLCSRVYFAATTAQQQAERGFFVIVYDWAPQNSLLTYPDIGMLFYKWYSIVSLNQNPFGSAILI